MAVGSYEKCKRYIEFHSPNQVEEIPKKRETFPCITISREAGAGAPAVCKELIKYLDSVSGFEEIQWTLFDRLLIEKILKDHNLPGQISRYMKEDKYRHLSSAINELLGLHPLQWTLLHKTTETVLQLARMGKVVIVGRGANIITAKLKNAFHVRLIAPMENKIGYIMNVFNLDRNEAEDHITKHDIARRNYIKSSFSKDVRDENLYHLIINTGLMTHKEAAKVIADAVVCKFPNYFHLSSPARR